jgi:hypothetical protein
MQYQYNNSGTTACQSTTHKKNVNNFCMIFFQYAKNLFNIVSGI